MNRDPIRSPARSIANLEFHHVGDEVNAVARRLIEKLETRGIRAINPAMGFPMEMDRFPGKIWVVSHKNVAAAAGLGKIGIHRNLIHPRFGNFILLGTVLMDAQLTTEASSPIDYNPCLECKLCVAACPVGAISPEGDFNFSACYTHNYREFMGGFTDWVETVADSGSRNGYRARVNDAESASMWQSLSFGANYKAAYCLAACPAGDDVIGPFLEDRAGFLNDVVKPLQRKEEPLYVIRNSDAEAHARRRFPHKTIRFVGSSLNPQTIAGFLAGLPLVFQPGQAGDLKARYWFTFTGEEQVEATIEIRNGKLDLEEGHHGDPDLRVTADTRTWLRFLSREVSILRAILTLRVRTSGDPRLLLAFGKCFPA
jgi:ferredoxin